MCAPTLNGNAGSFAGDGFQGVVMTNGANVGEMAVSCSFVDDVSSATSYDDARIANIEVDLTPGTAGDAAPPTSAQACVFSGWSVTCGTSVGSGTISAYGHGSINLTTSGELTAWQSDAGNGYAFVLVQTEYSAGAASVDVEGSIGLTTTAELAAWQNDTGGYAFVYVNVQYVTGDPGVDVVGVFYH
jgi:hypothetical protein